ncbi:UNVERIFIED_CONTAM: hypothetical protein FKN15_069979 [Acipenser sinensis]
MAQVLELLSRQASAAPATTPAPTLPQLPYPPSPRGDQGMADTLSIAPSWDRFSFSSGMDVGGELEPSDKADPSFEVASEASAPPLSDLTLALMKRAAAFLQVPWTPAEEPRRSIFRTQAIAPCSQKFPAFPDFMEEVRSSWDRPASAPSVLKQAAQLASLEDAISPGRLHHRSPGGRLSQRPELTVPWEDAVDEAYERKKLRYAQLATEAEQRGWRVRVYPVEVGCRGFVAHSTTRFLRDVGFSGQELRRTVKNLPEAAKRSSNWLWLRRKDSGWGYRAQ